MKYVTAIEAARRIGVAEKTVRLWVKSGKLDAHHPARNRLAIAESDVERLARERQQYQEEEDTGAPAPLDTAELVARIEQLEAKLATIETRLDQATLGQSYTFTPGETTPRQARSYNRTTGTAKGLPEGAVLAWHFAERYGVNQNTFRDHYTKGIGGEKLIISSRPKPSRPRETEWYITRDQAGHVFDFWSRHGVAYSMPEEQETSIERGLFDMQENQTL